MKLKPLPSQASLRSVIDYDRATGIFTWRTRLEMSPSWNSKWSGKVAGAKSGKGIVIFIGSVPYYAHRLAWVWVYGDVLDTETQIDHKNCDCYANWIDNLRPATHGQNASNSRLRQSKDLPKGVSRQMRGGGFRARIGIDGRVVALGTFLTPELAHAAYVTAAQRAKGEFARGR